MCAGCGDGAVEEVICSCQPGALGGGGAGEFEAVAAHSNADTVHFSFIWYVGGDHAGVGYLAPLRDGRFCYEKDSVGACWHACADPLGWASQIVDKSSDPGVSVGAADEVSVFKCLASGQVDDYFGLFLFLY